MLPATGVVDCLAPPHSRGAVEVEEHSRARTGAVLEYEMAIEQDGLYLRQIGIRAVQVRPARLQHSDCRVGEMVDHLHQPLGLGREIGVKDGHELAARYLQAGIERTGLEAFAVDRKST